jgi:hypothetical protein
MKKSEIMQNTKKNLTRSFLAQPLIPSSDPIDGLLTLEKLAQPVVMTFPVWNEAYPGHTYQLTWNEILTSEKKSITTEKPGDPLSLTIPSGLLVNDGTYQVGFGAINELGGQIAYSREIPLIVDRTPPGGNLLAPLLLDPNQLPLTAESLTIANNVLTARLPSYFDAKWGDVVRTYWGDQPGPERTLTAEELGGSNIVFTFERSFLEQLVDGDILVTYTVTDRAGNLSIVSEPALLRLQLRNYPQGLLAPVVPQANDGMIEHNDARHGVQVQIPQYGNAQAGDVIVLNWGGVALAGQVLTEAATLQPVVLSIIVPFDTVQTAGDGATKVLYEVHRDNQLRGTSPVCVVNVFVTLPGPQDPMPATLINERLAPPQIRGKSDNTNRLQNFLDEDDYLLNADAVIPWQDGFKACDQIHLYWGSWPLPVVRSLDQNDVDAAADLAICIPNALIAGEGVGRAIPVHYTVTHGGNPNTSRSSTQLVRVVRRAQLPGGECGLTGAIFNQADDTHTLRLPAVAEGTTVSIKPYRNMSTGDRLALTLSGFDQWVDGQPMEAASLVLTNTLDDFQILNGIVFNVPKALLEHFSTGRLEAKYRIENDYGIAWSLKSDVYVDRRTPQEACA